MEIGVAAGAKIHAGKTLDADAAQLAETGANSVRLSFKWERFEPHRDGVYVYDDAAAIVTAITGHGMKLCAGLTGWPDLSLTDPVLARAYAKAQAALAQHFDGLIDQYEGPNELNHARLTGAEFAELCKIIYEAVKTVAPDAFVVSGGLGGAKNGPNPGTVADYVTDMYAAGVAGHFDALGFHPYCYAQGGPLQSLRDERGGWWMMRLVHRVMRANREGFKPIWVTENGVPTGGPKAVTEEVAVEWLAEAVRNFGRHPWGQQGAYYHFTHIDAPASWPAEAGDHMGLLNVDGTPKATHSAFKLIAANGGA